MQIPNTTYFEHQITNSIPNTPIFQEFHSGFGHRRNSKNQTNQHLRIDCPISNTIILQEGSAKASPMKSNSTSTYNIQEDIHNHGLHFDNHLLPRNDPIHFEDLSPNLVVARRSQRMKTMEQIKLINDDSTLSNPMTLNKLMETLDLSSSQDSRNLASFLQNMNLEDDAYRTPIQRNLINEAKRRLKATAAPKKRAMDIEEEEEISPTFNDPMYCFSKYLESKNIKARHLFVDDDQDCGQDPIELESSIQLIRLFQSKQDLSNQQGSTI